MILGPEERLDAIKAAKRIGRRAELLRVAAGKSRWRRVVVFLIGCGAIACITYTWTFPNSVAAWVVILFVLALDSEMARRLDAVVLLIEEGEALPSKGDKEDAHPSKSAQNSV